MIQWRKPSARAWLRLDWFVSADADCNGWGKLKEMPHSEVDDNKTLLKVVNEIVHVYETREQIEFRDQTPLLELTPEDTDGNGSKSPH